MSNFILTRYSMANQNDPKQRPGRFLDKFPGGEFPEEIAARAPELHLAANFFDHPIPQQHFDLHFFDQVVAHCDPEKAFDLALDDLAV